MNYKLIMLLAFVGVVAHAEYEVNESDSTPINASVARQKADTINAEREALALPTLLTKCYESIKVSSSLGQYSTSVSISDFNKAAVKAAIDTLINKGYVIAIHDSELNYLGGGPFIDISWEK